MIRLLRCGALCGVLMVGMWMIGGCQGKADAPITKHTIWANMSPEKKTVAYTVDDRTTSRKRAFDYMWRQFHDDFDDFWFFHRPGKMTEFPIP